MTHNIPANHKEKRQKFLKAVKDARYIYLLLLPGIVYYILFNYLPIYGITLAFKEFKANLGILNSPFVGLSNYEFVFKDPAFYMATANTLIISLQRILLEFPVPVILALMINEIRGKRYKRFLQTVFTFPQFLSWVIVGGIVVNLFESDGALNNLIALFGMEKQSFLSNTTLFRPLLYITNSWKSAGWTSIIYLAAITSINTEQYEAALIDGASRLKQILYITLPGIKGTISVMFVLAIGNMMNGGFDQIFNMQNPAVKNVSEILDTYIYNITFRGATDFGFSTAVGLFKSVVNFILLILCDRAVKLMGEKGLFY